VTNYVWIIAPTLNIISITYHQTVSLQLDMWRRCLIPPWTKIDAMGRKLNNARGETVAEILSFRNRDFPYINAANIGYTVLQ